MNEINVNCLICNNSLKNKNNTFICSNKDHYFGIKYENNILLKYIIGYISKNNIEFSLASPYKGSVLETKYIFKILNNVSNDCKFIGETIFSLKLDEEEYFKPDTFNLNKVKDYLEKIYKLTIFI